MTKRDRVRGRTYARGTQLRIKLRAYARARRDGVAIVKVACRPTRVFRETWRKHPGARRDVMATSSCRVHALLSWRRAASERARARALELPFIYITRLLTRAQLAFSRDPSRVSASYRWRRLDAKKYINQVNICRVSSSYAGRIT